MPLPWRGLFPCIISVISATASYAIFLFISVSLGLSIWMTCVPTFHPSAIEGYFSMQASPCGYGLPENSQLLSLGVSNGCYPLVENPDPYMNFTNMPCDLCAADKLTIAVKYYPHNEAPSLRYKYVPIEDPTQERKRICGLSKNPCNEAWDTLSRVVSLVLYSIAWVLFTLVLKFEVLDNPRMTTLFKKSACLLGSLAFCNAVSFAFIVATFATTLSSMDMLTSVVLLALLQVINGCGLVLLLSSKHSGESQDTSTKRIKTLVIKFFNILGMHSSLDMLSYYSKHFETAETCTSGNVVDIIKILVMVLATALMIMDDEVKKSWFRLVLQRPVVNDAGANTNDQELGIVQPEAEPEPAAQHQLLA